MINLRIVGLALAAGFCSWMAAAQQCYVIDARGNKIAGNRLTADKDGNLSLQIEAGGAVTNFRAGAYQSAMVPKPRDVQALEQAYAGAKLDAVTAAAAKLYPQYQYLGWGGTVSYYEGMAMLDKGSPDAALLLFDRGLGLKDPGTEMLTKGKIQALLALKKTAEAQALVNKLTAAADPATAAFAFNARGKLLAAEGKKKEAVLQYLKTLLLFKPGTMVKERDEARQAVTALLRSMGDSRASDFEKMP